MAPRLFRIFVFALLTIALLAPSPSQAGDKELRSTIAFTSSRHDPNAPPGAAWEIYLINPDGTDPRRLTDNDDGEAFATISPDGKKIVFDSNRRRIDPEPGNTSDLFLMKTDGSEQTFLTRGSSASWSPDSKQVAFHASASGTGLPFRGSPGSATTDSDIFVMKVGECLEDVDACQSAGAIKQNLTNTNPTSAGEPYAVEDDADWSPDGRQIAFTSHLSNDNDTDSTTAEIYVMNADGTGRTQLTFPHNVGTQEEPVYIYEEERSPAWSPDGTRILFSCRPDRPTPSSPPRPFELCVMNADGSVRTELTHDGVGHLTATWSPGGEQIVFHRAVQGRDQLWIINADGTGQTQLTNTPGINGYASWGVLRITGQGEGQGAAGDDGTGKDGTADHGKQDKDNKAKHDKHKKAKQHKGGGKRHR